MSEKIAFIGVGNMGNPMAENLLNAGNEIKVFDVSKEMLKKAQKRRQGIETFFEEVPSKAKQFLTQGERATYQNIDDYLPDEDLSGILSVKGVQ